MEFRTPMQHRPRIFRSNVQVREASRRVDCHLCTPCPRKREGLNCHITFKWTSFQIFTTTQGAKGGRRSNKTSFEHNFHRTTYLAPYSAFTLVKSMNSRQTISSKIR